MSADESAPQGRGYEIAPEGSFKVTTFLPQGPVAAAFLSDDVHLFRAIMGPWGSGKTNAAFYDMFKWAARAPACDRDSDGVIRRRFAALVVRDTYRNLETTLRTWHGWMPKTKGEFKGGGGDRPATHEIEFDLLDGTVLHIIVQFKAIGDLSVEDALLGFEANWMFLNELTTLPIDIITYALGRLGRYPHPKLLGEDRARLDQRPQVLIADLNAPEEGHAVYDYFEKDCPTTAKMYRQPGGRSPDAENVHNLPAGYYENLLAANAKKKWWIKRFIDNEYGFSRDGLPVFEEDYDDIAHVADLDYEPELPIYLGFDGGMGVHPTCTMLQWRPSGHIGVIAELVPGRCLTGRFRELLAAWLNRHAPNARIAGAWIDPAAFRGEGSEESEFSFIVAVNKVLGVPLQQAPTNELGPRLDVIRDALGYRPQGRPLLQISRQHCPGLRSAFNSKYRYKLDTKGNLTNDPRPDKDEASDRMDCVGYALLGMIGLNAVQQGTIRAARPVIGQKNESRTGRFDTTMIQTDFDVFSV